MYFACLFICHCTCAACEQTLKTCSNEKWKLGLLFSNLKQELQYFGFIVDTPNTSRCWGPSLPQALDGNNGLMIKSRNNNWHNAWIPKWSGKDTNRNIKQSHHNTAYKAWHKNTLTKLNQISCTFLHINIDPLTHHHPYLVWHSL